MQAIIIAGIFIGMIIVITCILLCLFKYGKVQIFYAIIVLSLAAGLGYEGSQLMNTIVRFFNVPLDYITLVFCFYNSKRLQGFEPYCGLYSIFFVLFAVHEKLDDFFSVFTDNYKKNDAFFTKNLK